MVASKANFTFVVDDDTSALNSSQVATRTDLWASMVPPLQIKTMSANSELEFHSTWPRSQLEDLEMVTVD